jgi:arylsulfatase A-like enzyme
MKISLFFITVTTIFSFSFCSTQQEKFPNIILIYTDDVGYGDISSYGANEIKTPNIDRIADEGLLFTNSHSTSATCTPSRYGLLTGEYPWRKENTGIAPGNAAMIIKAGTLTLPSVLKQAGYVTGVVGKWHLGLGPEGGLDWNGEIRPGPNDIGFDYAFLIPATGDRVPCVYVENRRVVNLDPNDPIDVSFDKPIGNDPTGKEHPELLKMHPSQGHDQTIVNGISRIGYMSGGHSARWIDEKMADVITGKSIHFINENKDQPFFLLFSTHDIHVPRVPHPRYKGKSGLGARGDAILQLDGSVGEILITLDSLDLANKTIVIFTSDNGPVVDDGYHDRSVELLNGHNPSGSFRGGKYSAFEAGTRIPFIIRWPGHIHHGISKALISQIDLMASLASFTGQNIPDGSAPDSFNQWEVLTGIKNEGRSFVIEHAVSGALSLLKNNWKYIEPHSGPTYNPYTDIELGNAPESQLYDLKKDLKEKVNVAEKYPKVVQEMDSLLTLIKKSKKLH